MKEITICPRCKKTLRKYIESSCYCQRCYREVLREYSFYKYKEMPKEGSKEKRICEMVINGNYRAKDIVELYGEELGLHSVVYVRTIIARYLTRCNTLGEERVKM